MITPSVQGNRQRNHILKIGYASSRDGKYFNSLGSPINLEEDTQQVILYHPLHKAKGDEADNIYSRPIPQLPKVAKLKITVARTWNSSVPCLGRVECYVPVDAAKAAGFKEEPQRAELANIFCGGNLFGSNGSAVDVGGGGGGGGSSAVPMLRPAPVAAAECKKKGQREEDEEDQRFLDPITNGIMLSPMVLPSGHTIDYSTLQRILNDKDNGRDPFSGIKLHESDCIPNVPLKGALDRRAFARAAAAADGASPVAPRTARPWASAAIERRYVSQSLPEPERAEECLDVPKAKKIRTEE